MRISKQISRHVPKNRYLVRLTLRFAISKISTTNHHIFHHVSLSFLRSTPRGVPLEHSCFPQHHPGDTTSPSQLYGVGSDEPGDASANRCHGAFSLNFSLSKISYNRTCYSTSTQKSRDSRFLRSRCFLWHLLSLAPIFLLAMIKRLSTLAVTGPFKRCWTPTYVFEISSFRHSKLISVCFLFLEFKLTRSMPPSFSRFISCQHLFRRSCIYPVFVCSFQGSSKISSVYIFLLVLF